MTEATAWAAVLGAASGALITVLLVLARRLARGGGDLGSDAEQAAYRALHEAGLAATHLRGGLAGGDLDRAARHLRSLLGSATVALVHEGRVVALDGETSDAVQDAAVSLAARVADSGRRQVTGGTDGEGKGIVGAPIVVDGRVVGVLVAVTDPMRAALVRAVGEVADWCAAQLALGELDASRAALAEAELRSLRAQISPHFIYNALTAIASFITTEPARARELVLEFADFTRYSFRRQGEFTTLAEELRSIHSYLELERARFGDRLQVVLRIAPETLATVIPFLSVQPIVENAVRCGTASSRASAAAASASRPATTRPTPRSSSKTTVSAWTPRRCAPCSTPRPTALTSASAMSTCACGSSTVRRAGSSSRPTPARGRSCGCAFPSRSRSTTWPCTPAGCAHDRRAGRG